MVTPPGSNVLNSSEFARGYLVHRLQQASMRSEACEPCTLAGSNVASALKKLEAICITSCLRFKDHTSENRCEMVSAPETSIHACYLKQGALTCRP